MHWLLRMAIVIAGNALALWIANILIPGFVLHATWGQLVVIGLVLSLLNFIVKPILTLALGPIIVLTLGLGVIIVNALIIWLLPILADHLDFLKGSISIESIPALLFTTLIVGVINFLIHLVT